MGFFSWKCAVCDESIPAHPWAGKDIEMSHVVMVLPDNTTKAGIYDGYGNIELDNEEGEIDIYETIAPFYFKKPCVRRDVFNNTKYLISPDGEKHTIDQFRYDEPLSKFNGMSMNDLQQSGWDITSDFYLIQPMIKIVRFDQYHGQSYEELKSSESCPDQGFFY